jgi:outer membrane lipoprotein-sorting protein
LIIESRRPIIRLVVVATPLKAVLVACALLLLAPPSLAQSDGLTADQITQKIIHSSAFDWDGAKTRMKMVLAAKDGAKQERALEILARKKEGLVQTVVRFRAPTEVAGTAFLILEQKGGGSEQYIYLPGLRRTRRIVGREREGSFMGSEFSYTDFRRIDTTNATQKRLPDEKVGDTAAFVVESIPKKEAKSPYAKIQTWVRKADFVPLRTRFFDTKGQLLKTLYSRKIGKVETRPVVLEARMENHQTGAATLLVVDAIERRDDLPDSAFTPTALEHP